MPRDRRMFGATTVLLPVCFAALACARACACGEERLPGGKGAGDFDSQDASGLLSALNCAITKSLAAPKEHSGRLRGECAALLRTAEKLIARGADVPAVPTSPGEAVFFAMASSLREGFRPPGLKVQWLALLEHEVPYVREKALDYAPPALTPLLAPKVAPLLGDANLDVQIAACHFVGRTKSESLREPLLKTLASAKEQWLFNAARLAANEIGAQVDALEVMAGRLDDPEAAERCLDALGWFLSNDGARSGSAKKPDAATGKALKERWRKFFADHGAALRAGRKLKPGDAEVKPDLFAGCVSFTLPDGTRWPNSPQNP